MENYTYVTKEEVQRVCHEIGIADWTALVGSDVKEEDATKIRKLIGGETLDIPLKEFMRGLEIELEHGLQFADANVTNNHPILTGRIVLAHLKEGLDYYLRLDCMEVEMELAKEVVAMNVGKIAMLTRKLAEQRMKIDANVLSKLA